MKQVKALIFFLLFFSCCTGFSQDVYTTKTGEKYHKETCRYLKYSKRTLPIEKAIALGYEACKVCKPIKKSSSSAASTNSITTSSKSATTTKKATYTQCTGKTQAGTRCKRMTKSANGRCYQH